MKRPSLYLRLQAWALTHASARYEPLIAPRKHALLGRLTGEVLELGAGTGANARYYGPQVHVTAIEPNPYSRQILARAFADAGVAATVLDGDVQALPFKDASVDTVVASLFMCTVADPAAGLAEILRVLKPGGRYYFVEHVAAQAGLLRRAQSWLSPLVQVLADGCHPDRDSAAAIRRAGFSHVELEAFGLPLHLMGPHIAGNATK